MEISANKEIIFVLDVLPTYDTSSTKIITLFTGRSGLKVSTGYLLTTSYSTPGH